MIIPSADLKTAMRAKATTRLSVLRSLLAATQNASKTSTPITTEPQLLALIRKNIKKSKAAALEFQENGREELWRQEMGEVKILQEYEGGVIEAGDGSGEGFAEV